MKILNKPNLLFLFFCLVLTYLFSIIFIENNELLFGAYAIFGLALFFVLFLTLQKIKKNITINIIDVAVFIWLLYSTLRLVFSQNNNLRWLVFYSIASMSGIYFLFRLQSGSKEKKQLAFSFFLLLTINFALIQVIIFILQKLSIVDVMRGIAITYGSFVGAGAFSVFMAFTFIVAFWCILFIKPVTLFHKIIHYESIALFLLLIFISPHTESRSSWMIMAIGTLIILYFRYKTIAKQIFSNRYVLISSLTVACILSGVAVYYMYNYKKASADGRMIVWKVTLDKAGDAVLYGQGTSSFQSRYLDWQGEWFGKKERSARDKLLAGNVVRCYNDFLLELVERGLFGLLILVALFWLAMKRLKSHTEERKALFVAIITGIITGSMVTFTLSTPYISMLFFIVLALISNDDNRSLKSIQLSYTLPLQILFILIIIMLVVSGIIVWKRTYQVNTTMRAIRYYEDDYEAVISERNRHQNLFDKETTLLSSYIWALHVSGKYESCITEILKYNRMIAESRMYGVLGDCYLKLKKYGEAEKAYKTELNMIPNRFLPLYKLQHLYIEKDDTNMALKTADEMLQKPVKIASPAIDEMRQEVWNYIQEIKHGSNE